MKSAYSNTQILDRLFNQNSTNSTGSNKKRSVKGQNAGNSAVALPKGSNAPADFMPSSATSATAFYAATKQAAQQSQKFSNYQLQNLSKQKNLMIQK